MDEPEPEPIDAEALIVEDAPPDGPRCAACRAEVDGEYYDVNGATLCGSCYGMLYRHMTGGSAPRRFARATLFGIGGVVLGSGIYFAVLRLTGVQLGLVAILVGLIVGAAVRKGSDRRGGTAYQLLAVFLTYTAIVMTSIPDIVDNARRQAQAQPRPKPAAQARPMGVGRALGLLTLASLALVALAFAMPILGPGHAPVMLLIIGFALWEAWKINRRPVFKVAGPFEYRGLGGILVDH